MARGRGKLTPQDKIVMKEFSNKLVNLLEVRNCKQAELSRGTGIPPSTLTGYVKGTSLPVPGNVQKIADFFGLKKSDLDSRFKPNPTLAPPVPQVELIPSTLQKITMTSEQLNHDRQQTVLDVATDQLERQQKEESIVEEDNIIYYPYDYYDHAVSAGTGLYLSDVDVETIELPLDVSADFVVPVRGDSMEPDYHHDDYVFIKLTYNLSDGDIGIFYYNGEAYIKQLCIDGKKAYLHSINPDYPDMPITEDTDFRIIGEVVEKYGER